MNYNAYRNVAQELASHVIGPLPIQSLFDQLLQADVDLAFVEKHSDFSQILTENNDPDNKHIIRNLVPKANLLLNDMKLVDTQDKPPYGPRVDDWYPAIANAYSTPARSSGSPSTRKPSINCLAVGKSDDQDNFYHPSSKDGMDDNPPFTYYNALEEVEFYVELGPQEYEVFGDHSKSFVCGTNSACSAFAHMGSMFANIMAKQNRTHLFSVHLTTTGDARIIYWDHAVILVSASFPYAVQTSMLGQFFYRFSRAKPAIRGHDISISPANKAEADEALAYFQEFKNNRTIYLNETRPTITSGDVRDKLVQYIAIEVPDENAMNKTKTRRVIAHKLPFTDEDPMSRVTRGYLVYDTVDKRIGWLKDSWVKEEVVPKEWDVLKQLNAAMVPCVPTFVCGGPIAAQRMLYEGYFSEKWNKAVKNAKCCPTRIHQRFLVREVGSFLCHSLDKEPKCHSRYVVSRIAEAIHAHEMAVKAGCLHRDISESNVLHVRVQPNEELKDQALLIDWDMAKDMTTPVARQYERTGTWPFMSINMLSDEPIDHSVSDDLESFFWLLTYLLLRYLQWKCNKSDSTKDSATVLCRLFESSDWDVTMPGETGGDYKRLLLHDAFDKLKMKFLSFSNDVPTTTLFVYLITQLQAFCECQATISETTMSPGSEDQSRKTLETMMFGGHNQQLVQYLRTVVESSEWPKDDKWADQCPNYHSITRGATVPPPANSFQTMKKQHQESQHPMSSNSHKRPLEGQSEESLHPRQKRRIVEVEAQ
ncbi:hypothetical protein DL96DRAFT_1620008 [Flagelloscypha sp. PMI_526]|nr:hypothetical protein DL96DRAFT_1620008 [Flagelloscypha sp. PMI_526]